MHMFHLSVIVCQEPGEIASAFYLIFARRQFKDVLMSLRTT